MIDEISVMISKVVKAFGSLHIMINNASVTRTSDIMGLNEDDWYWINNINSKGTFFVSKLQQNK